MRPRKTWKVHELPAVRVVDVADSVLKGLDPKRLAILVGAGVSVKEPSRFPTALQFLRAFYEACLPESCGQNLFLSSDLRFETLLDLVQHRFDENLDLLNLFRDGTPNQNHRCLNALAQQGALIITTNFDTLIERAGPEYLEYRIRVREKEFADIVESGGPARLVPEFWHLHGILADPRSKENCRDTVIASIRDCWRSKDLFRLEKSKGLALEKALSDRDLLVVGYSGSDDYDIAPALEEIHSERRLVWVHHASQSRKRVGDGVTPVVMDYLPDNAIWYRACCLNSLATMLSSRNRLPDKVHLLRCDTELVLEKLARIPDEHAYGKVSARNSGSFFDRLSRKLSYALPGSRSRHSSKALRSYFEMWQKEHLPNALSQYLLAILICKEANLYEEGERLLMESAQVHSKLSAESHDEELVRSAIEISCLAFGLAGEEDALDAESLLKDVDSEILEQQPTFKAVHQTALGRIYVAGERIEEAISCFKESLAIRHNTPFLRDIEVAEYDLAHALFVKGHDSRNLAEAEREANNALQSALSASHPEGIARSYLLLGRINERLDRFEAARKYYEQASDAAYRSGNEHLIAMSYGEFGFYFLTLIVKRQSEHRAKLLESMVEHLRERERKMHPSVIEAMIQGAINVMALEPITLKGAEREEGEQAAKYLAEAFRIHSRHEHWGGLGQIAGNLAESLEIIGQGARSVLADCTAFRCALFFKNEETVQTSLGRIIEGAQRELPEVDLTGLDEQDFVGRVQKELLDRNVLI